MDWVRKSSAFLLSDFILLESGEAFQELGGARADQVNCPLCGRGWDFHWGGGFKFPRGLEMHLLGAAKARPCRVLAQVSHVVRSELSGDEW